MGGFQRGADFLFVCLAWFAVIVPGAVARPGLTASTDRFERKFLSTQSTSPNQIAAPNRRLRLGRMPWSFSFFMSQGSAVGELTSEVIQQGIF